MPHCTEGETEAQSAAAPRWQSPAWEQPPELQLGPDPVRPEGARTGDGKFLNRFRALTRPEPHEGCPFSPAAGWGQGWGAAAPAGSLPRGARPPEGPLSPCYWHRDGLMSPQALREWEGEEGPWPNVLPCAEAPDGPSLRVTALSGSFQTRRQVCSS